MIRQAHTYLVGAMSGATLIAIAIAVFVVLVSAQVFKDWPIAALSGGGNETAPVSTGHPAGGTATSAAGGPNVITASASLAKQAAGKPANGNGSGSVAASDGVGAAGGSHVATTAPSESAAGAGGRSGGSGAAAPQSPSPTGPSGTSGSSSSGGGSAGSGGGGATRGSASGTTAPPAGQVTETVNGTVAKVDETALGGTLHETGVTEVTESVVNGVAGPESTVGKVGDETVGAVGGLLHGSR